MARGHPFIRHLTCWRSQIVRLNIIYSNVQVFDSWNTSNTSNLNSHNAENIYSDPNSDWPEGINEFCRWLHRALNPFCSRPELDRHAASSTENPESKPAGAPQSPDMFPQHTRPHGLTETAKRQVRSACLWPQNAINPATCWPFGVPYLLTCQIRIELIEHVHMSFQVPSWVDSEDANDTNPPKGLQRATVKRASRGLETRLRSVWRLFFWEKARFGWNNSYAMHWTMMRVSISAI